MGLYQNPKVYNERLEFVTGIFAELGKRLKQRAGSLSGGERQMVAMRRALMMEPHVLLLDEPSAGLSPVRQDEAFLRVSEINKAGVTTIMVEQNARRCLQICDRGYVLDQGRDAYTGTGRELLNDPKVIGLYLGTLGEDAGHQLQRRRADAASIRALRLSARRRGGAQGKRRAPDSSGALAACSYVSRVLLVDARRRCCPHRTRRYRWWPRSGRQPRRT